MALKGTAVLSWGDSWSNNPSGFVSIRVKNLNTARNFLCFGGFSGNKATKSVEDENPAKPTIENVVSRGLYKDLSLTSLPKPLSVADLTVTPNNEKKVRISFKGLPGSYSEEAALKAYPKCETLPCDEFEDVFKAVELWLADKAVLPIENSSGGSIHRNYDLLLRHRLHIMGEVQLVSNLCLLALPGIRTEQLKRVLSHPQALASSDVFLSKLGVAVENVDDTAGAAQYVASNGLRDVGVIASARAAEIYGLNILANRVQIVTTSGQWDMPCVSGGGVYRAARECDWLWLYATFSEGDEQMSASHNTAVPFWALRLVQDDPGYITRFLVLARDPMIPKTNKPFKTSIVFTLDEGPGVLFKALAVFALREINLTKIESRPQRKKPLRVVDDSNTGNAKYFDYLFYIDFEASMAEPRAQSALGHLQTGTAVIEGNLHHSFACLVAIQWRHLYSFTLLCHLLQITYNIVIVSLMALKGTAVLSWGDSWSNNPSGFVSNRVKNLNTARNFLCFGGFSGNRAIKSVEDENQEKPTIENDVSRGLYKDLSLTSLPKPLSVVTPNNDTKVRISFKGLPGSYSEEAALKAYPKCETVHCNEFEDVFKAVELLIADKAVLPIENSSGGSIHRNYDLLLRHRLHITGEVQLVSDLCLLALPGIRAEQLKRVLSHPQALAFCDVFLSKLGVAVDNVDDTAAAAQYVASNGLKDAGVIASARAAEIYGLNILANGVQASFSLTFFGMLPVLGLKDSNYQWDMPCDEPGHITRFLVLSRDPIIPRTDKPFKTSIVFTLDEGPGVLFKALAVFASRDINLSKIESRPQRKKPLRVVDDSNTGNAKYFDYLFYIDFEASMAEPRAQSALGHLQVSRIDTIPSCARLLSSGDISIAVLSFAIFSKSPASKRCSH
ncbi:hypothetical protein EZV62_020637 [Acer yangbiense]|uniref:arogenate dehydratase n=1 Tax=Acer yangbiense TaxID=1000413 RepID=A0A5C7HEN0_9ROSI|nr:hypothetical protein EZV62_020637 [Acer yangbiense]